MSAPRSSAPWPARLIAVYPANWRARYGDELDQLVADLGDRGRPPLAMAADLLRGAMAAWLTGRESQMTERAKAALITVLWSWVAFAATAAWFGHDLAVFPSPRAAERIALVDQAVPGAYHALLVAGAIGVAATAVAAVVFAVDAARYARQHRRRSTFILMVAPIVVAACWLGGLRLVPVATDSAGSLAFAIGWLLLGIAGVAGSTQAVVRVVRSTEFSMRTWRVGTAAGAVVTAAMVVVTCATIAWGLAERASTVQPAGASNWLVVTAILAVTTVRAVLALAAARRTAPSDEPAVA